MSKCIIILFMAGIIISFIMPNTVYADELILKPPVLEYKLVNHDKIALRWTKSENADKYYIYQLNTDTGKYTKKGEVKTTACTINNLTAETEYSYAVVAVKDEIKSKVSNKVIVKTPPYWNYYSKNKAMDGYTLGIGYRSNYDGSNEEEEAYIFSQGLKYYNGWLYYINVKDELGNMGFFRSKNDGTDEELLYENGNNMSDFIIGDDYVYFIIDDYYGPTDTFYGSKVYCLSIDTKEISLIYETKGSVQCYTIYKNHFYNILFEGPNGEVKTNVYHTDPINKNRELICDLKEFDNSFNQNDFLYIDNECIYYSASYYTDLNEKKYAINEYQLNTGKTRHVFTLPKLNSKYATKFENGCFYITIGYNDNMKYYKIKSDGTGLKTSDKPFEWRY